MDTYRAIGPLLRLLPAETAHGLALGALRLGLVPPAPARGMDDPVLASRVWGRDFANPIGLAAGFDKDARVIDAMLGTGFGFVEVGTITPKPQAGNPRPRLFRLSEDEAVINRLGFNSAGMVAAAARLERRRKSGRQLAGPIGINLGKNKDTVDAGADFAAAAEILAPFADYLAINVSSPNTPGLRALQNRAQLEDLLARVGAARTSLTGCRCTLRWASARARPPFARDGGVAHESSPTYHRAGSTGNRSEPCPTAENRVAVAARSNRFDSSTGPR